MVIDQAVEAYIQAWNDHDAVAVAMCFGADGTFEDPTTGGPLKGELIEARAGDFFAGFPDGSLKIDVLDVVGPHRAYVQYRARGTNTAVSALGSPTGKAIDVPGIAVFDFDPDTGFVASARSYWDFMHFLGSLRH